MRKIFTLIILMAAVSICGAQTDYNYVNQGFNLILETEGMGNEAAGLGGVSCTVGYQMNPNIFIGGGLKTIWGGRREFRKYRNHESNNGYNSYPTSKDNSYWINPADGNRYLFHAFNDKGEEVFLNDYVYAYEHEYDYETGIYRFADLYDADGNPLVIYERDLYYENNRECGWGGDYAVFKVVPYVCVRYNMLAQARVTPFADLRLGWDIARQGDNEKYGIDFSAMVGARFAIRDGDQAINLSAGFTATDLRGYADTKLWGVEKMFMMRFGFEF